MTANGWFQIALFLLLILAVTKPMGVFMARVFNREKTFMDPVLRPIERVLYRVTGVDETHEMRWTEYTIAMLFFSGVSMLLLYVIERVQQWLPWNPQHLAAVAPDLAFNTAASFTTNTNWQAYVPETTISYFTQMAGLAYHNFMSAAVGIAIAIALVRGIARRESETIGNFWVDLTRCILWVLLPVCLVVSLVFVSQGVIQNWWRQAMMGGAKAQSDGIKAFSETDFTEDLKKIEIPVLVMHGDDDQIVPIGAAGLISAKILKKARGKLRAFFFLS